jgi:prepilin-type N-terminal cleavage/methylation domain-containing protein
MAERRNATGRAGRSAGFTLLELLVSLTVLLLVMSGLATMMIGNAKIDKAQRMRARAHADARNCLAMVVEKLRSAGWDPRNAGIASVTLDADPGDGVEEIEVFADLDEDTATDSPGEQVLIRHSGETVSWRNSADTSAPFDVVAVHIDNDENGDGIPEPMFVPDRTPNPTRIAVRVTARSPVPDPTSGRVLRYTVTSEVTLRKAL